MRLLGRQVTVTKSNNKSQVGLSGLVVEDDHDTLCVRTSTGEKRVVKNTVTIQTDGFIIEGKDLRGTHAQRVKQNK